MSSEFFEKFNSMFSIGHIIISWIVWGVIAYFLSQHAKKNGENPTLHFILVFFAKLVGVAVSLILISSKKNKAQNGQPKDSFNNYNNGSYSGSNGFNSYNTTTNNAYFTEPNTPQKSTSARLCPSCGHEQTNGGKFCIVCGSPL